jgi:hypothetical protein
MRSSGIAAGYETKHPRPKPSIRDVHSLLRGCRMSLMRGRSSATWSRRMMRLLVIESAGATLAFVMCCGSANSGLSSPVEASSATDLSRAALDQWLRAFDRVPAATVASVEDDVVRRVLPADHFYSVRFSRYPHAEIPPTGLQLENLVCVQPDHSVKTLDDTVALGAFFAEKIAPVRGGSQARDVVGAYLRLAQEFKQDGGYKFVVPEESILVNHDQDHLVVSGAAVVAAGGSGQISATLTFDASGKLVNVASSAKVRPDVRPR